MDIFKLMKFPRITNKYGLVFSILYMHVWPWNNVIFKVINIARFGFSPLLVFLFFSPFWFFGFCFFSGVGFFSGDFVFFQGFFFRGFGFLSNIYNYLNTATKGWHFGHTHTPPDENWAPMSMEGIFAHKYSAMRSDSTP